MELDQLPSVRSSERKTYKRCVKKWYWEWRRGLVPRATQFGALELGTWVHDALAHWYMRGTKRHEMGLVELFRNHALLDIRVAETNRAPSHTIEKAEELLSLGEAMLTAYQAHYGNDEKVHVIAVELPLNFTIPDENGQIVAIHKIKPDMIFLKDQEIWLMEHKTAAAIRTEHLAIDDQARPYGSMAERALRNSGLLKRFERYLFKGIMYNFLRKALPDQRPTNAKGQYLNQNGSVSKRQPPANFVREPITLTSRSKVIALNRIAEETIRITKVTLAIRNKELDPHHLPKTPHWSCPKHCQFWAMCKAEEEGANIRDMEKALYIRRDPYTYDDQNGTTDEVATFEMG